jgi:hypothetical protein
MEKKMKPAGNPYFRLSILSICVLLSQPQSANTITIDELADKEQVVTSEGISFEELDKQIRNISGELKK